MTTTNASNAVQALEHARYISLETYKRDGQPVRVPVWVFRSNGALTIWTDLASFKIRRLRNNPAFKAAPCNANGKKILGEWVEGTARIVEDAAAVAAAENDIKAKYGWQVGFIRFINRFRGKSSRYALIVLDPGARPPSAA